MDCIGPDDVHDHHQQIPYGDNWCIMNRANHALTASSSSVIDVLASLDMPRNRLAAHHHIVDGASYEAAIKLVALLGSDTRTVCAMIGIHRDALNRRIRRGAHLSPAQGDRLYWVVLALEAVISLHNDNITKPMRWLTRPAWGLGGERPAEVLTSPMGAQAVIDLTGRIEHGVPY